jgi:hypothetical protein
VGLIYGTFGINKHTIGILGGIAISKKVELLHTAYDFNNALTYHWVYIISSLSTHYVNLYLDLNLFYLDWSFNPYITAVVIEQLGMEWVLQRL